MQKQIEIEVRHVAGNMKETRYRAWIVEKCDDCGAKCEGANPVTYIITKKHRTEEALRNATILLHGKLEGATAVMTNQDRPELCCTPDGDANVCEDCFNRRTMTINGVEEAEQLKLARRDAELALMHAIGSRSYKKSLGQLLDAASSAYADCETLDDLNKRQAAINRVLDMI